MYYVYPVLVKNMRSLAWGAGDAEKRPPEFAQFFSDKEGYTEERIAEVNSTLAKMGLAVVFECANGTYTHFHGECLGGAAWIAGVYGWKGTGDLKNRAHNYVARSLGTRPEIRDLGPTIPVPTVMATLVMQALKEAGWGGPMRRRNRLYVLTKMSAAIRRVPMIQRPSQEATAGGTYWVPTAAYVKCPANGRSWTYVYRDERMSKKALTLTTVAPPTPTEADTRGAILI